MKDKYVWYACYGSNLKKERFLCYIQGGDCQYNGRHYQGCDDKREPVKDRSIDIPHRLYFANSSGSWDGGGVAFIDPDMNTGESTRGRMYLITEEQFKQVHEQEGPGDNWYGKLLDLGEAEGYRIKTFTNAKILPANSPKPTYLRAMSDGLKETYPEMDDEEIDEYIANCKGERL